jgi:hypothetical protein
LAERVPARLNAAEGRRFAFTVGLAFLALAALLHWRGRHALPFFFAVLGGSLLVMGLVLPNRLTPVHRAWMALAHAISRVTTPIFMALIYFLTIVPIGLVRRALGWNPLVRPERAGGYWVERPADHRDSDLKRQF